MRFVIAAAAACSLLASVALAQTTTDQTTPAPTDQSQPAQEGPSNAAVKSMHENNASAPVAGANSFTRAEAKSAIEAKGYTHVAKLKKDKHGVWRAMAKKDGQTGPVSLDFQGNVN